MTKALLKRLLSLGLVLALITAMALTMVSCDTEESATTEGAAEAAPTKEELGAFILTVVFADGSEEVDGYVFTEAGNLGDYLVDNGIAEGEQGEYGLYIKTVLGETHDYDTDGSYWALYIDGEYATAGVSDIPLTDGAEYTLKAE